MTCELEQVRPVQASFKTRCVPPTRLQNNQEVSQSYSNDGALRESRQFDCLKEYLPWVKISAFSGIENHRGRDSMKKVETVEKNVLPSKEDIEAEKKLSGWRDRRGVLHTVTTEEQRV